MKKPILAGNWKMNMTQAQAKGFFDNFDFKTEDFDILFFPPFTTLPALRNTGYAYGAQNMYFEDKGAFTGQISSEMLTEAGCTYVIIGHSEPRHIFKETDELINKKVKKAIESGLTPILCVGELIEQREAGKEFEVVKEQLDKGLNGVDTAKVIIAYEPVWAIGTGKVATPNIAQKMHEFISKNTPGPSILYGGSVKPDNWKELLNQPNIDGALVGGASLKPDVFTELAKITQEYSKNNLS